MSSPSEFSDFSEVSESESSPIKVIRDQETTKSISNFKNYKGTMKKVLEEEDKSKPKIPSFNLSFSSTPVRDLDQIRAVRPEVTKQVRWETKNNERGGKDYLAIAARATVGTSRMLDIIDYAELTKDSSGDATIFDNNKEIEDRISAHEAHCNRFDMSYLMKNFPILAKREDCANESDRNYANKTIDLFKSWDMIGSNKVITLEDIADTTAWLKKYTSLDGDIFLEDIDWVDRHLQNSVTEKLKTRIDTRIKQKFPDSQYHGGPLTFAIIIEECINLSHSAITAMVKSIDSIDIKNVIGEDISLVCGRLIYAINRLKNNNALPADIIEKLMKLFKTSSVTEFTDFINHMHRSHTLGTETYTCEGLLERVETLYKNMVISNDWNGVKLTESSFVSETTKSSRSGNNFSAPTDQDKISEDPLRHERIIKGRTFMHCAKCRRRQGSKLLGRWNTTHFTDQHTNKSSDSDPQENANLAEESEVVKKSVSFKDTLLNAQKNREA